MSAKTRLDPSVFVMAGGGTGGHVMPLLAVAQELKQRGHAVLFIGTRTGIEGRLAPASGFPIEYIDIGGLKGVGLMRKLRTLWSLPFSTWRVLQRMGSAHARAV